MALIRPRDVMCECVRCLMEEILRQEFAWSWWEKRMEAQQASEVQRVRRMWEHGVRVTDWKRAREEE